MPDFEDGLTACFVGLVQPFKTSVLVFASGKIVITGLKSSEQIEQVIKRIKGLLSFENSLVFGIYTLFYTLFYTFSHAFPMPKLLRAKLFPEKKTTKKSELQKMLSLFLVTYSICWGFACFSIDIIQGFSITVFVKMTVLITFPSSRIKKVLQWKNKSKKVLIETIVDRSAELALQETMRSDLDNI